MANPVAKGKAVVKGAKKAAELLSGKIDDAVSKFDKLYHGGGNPFWDRKWLESNYGDDIRPEDYRFIVQPDGSGDLPGGVSLTPSRDEAQRYADLAKSKGLGPGAVGEFSVTGKIHPNYYDAVDEAEAKGLDVVDYLKSNYAGVYSPDWDEVRVFDPSSISQYAPPQPSELLGGTTAERMARAAEQGYDLSRPVYHSTATDFDAFDPDRAIGTQFWSTTDKAAAEAGDVGAQGRGVIKEMYHRIQNPAGWDEYDKYSIDELIARGYDGLALPDANGHITYNAFSPNQYRDVKADFNPANRDSPNLLASLAIPVAAGLAGTAALAPQEAEAGIVANDPQYQQDAMEAYSAAQGFAQRRASKADHWKALRQEVIDLANSVGDFTSNTVFPALDKPLQGYMGLSAVAGQLARGNGIQDALQLGAAVASQPTDQTAYQYGQTVTDTLSPYLPNEVAAGAGALTNAGVLLGSPL